MHASKGFHRQWHYSRERRLFCPQWMGTTSYALHSLLSVAHSFSVHLQLNVELIHESIQH
jgi:hypothetical protein